MVKSSDVQTPQHSSTLSEARSSFMASVEDAQAQASADLLIQLGLMVNNPTFSDVVFVCNDGKQVSASKIILAGRSDVLKRMLMAGMAESGRPKIKLRRFSSPVLLSVFEFLYTGTVSNYHPGSWRAACELVMASRFFLLPNLESIARKFMLDHTASVALDFPLAASLLTEAVEFRVLRDEPDVSLKELVTILSSTWSESGFLRDASETLMNLSEDAFHYLLANTKGNCEGDSILSFEEYLRFREVLRWCVNYCGVGGVEPESLVNHITVNEKTALSIYRTEEDKIESSSACAACFKVWSSFKRVEAFRNTAVTLLQNIDFRLIHPVLLAKVVEPLELVSSEEILNAFRFQALRRPMTLQRAACGSSHRVIEEGYIICKVDPTIGSAVLMARMSAPYAIYEWKFCIQEMPKAFCELGFVCSSRLEVEETSFQGRKLSDLRCARVLCLTEARAKINWECGDYLSLDGSEGNSSNASEDDSKDDWEDIVCGMQNTWAPLRGVSGTRGTTVVFTLDVCERTCALTVDGRCFGIVWENLPRAAAYYPAVSLGTSAIEGQVKVDLVRGFDFACRPGPI